MLKLEDIKDRIKEILISEIYVEVPIADMNDNDSLRDIFGVDSMGFVELQAQLEVDYEIKISEDDFNPHNFGTIENLANLVWRLKE
ncbi:acyl carrier protein [Acinetobacter sp. A47]|uniref:acyl carrier protein n=1 Tax=Acinetobacter sp. A47 TaxID=1561217 RepID=UPI00056DA7F3|nr:acyl carrier protein [Acinetobacter sp. A47]